MFFDDVGWPWPKHGCTDQVEAQKSKVVFASAAESGATRHDWTKSFMVFGLVYLHHFGGQTRLRLREIPCGISGIIRAIFVNTERTYALNLAAFEGGEVLDQDFHTAPSFLMSKADLAVSAPYIHFICARLGKIVSVRLKRVHDV